MRDMRACNRCAERTFLNEAHLTNNHSIPSAAQLSKHVYIILRANGIKSGPHELIRTCRLYLAFDLKVQYCNSSGANSPSSRLPGFCLLSSCSKHSTCSRQVAVSRRLRSETYIHMHTTPSLRANVTCSVVFLCSRPFSCPLRMLASRPINNHKYIFAWTLVDRGPPPTNLRLPCKWYSGEVTWEVV